MNDNKSKETNATPGAALSGEDSATCSESSRPRELLSSKTVLQQIEVWIEREKERRRCPHLRNYPHPGFACDFHENCESCLLVAAALELRKNVPVETPPPVHVRIPTSESEAELMTKLGMQWLEQHAPHRLTNAHGTHGGSTT